MGFARLLLVDLLHSFLNSLDILDRLFGDVDHADHNLRDLLHVVEGIVDSRAGFPDF